MGVRIALGLIDPGMEYCRAVCEGEEDAKLMHAVILNSRKEG